MSSPQASARQRRIATRAARTFLPELQALRMWAVGLVVVFHLWPTGWFPGGFVGVDAFFVISGYLITGHLLRELERTGKVRLGAFYARRARRLLPASLTVLLVSAGLTRWLLPQDVWEQTAGEIRAATLYAENLWLASRAVTYSGSGDAPSLVQHYWSLSTEEQFYLVWPALILGGAWLARRLAPRRPVAVIGAVLTLTGLVSLVASLVLTHQDQSAAYFLTWTRAWEFAVGGLLPLVLRRYAPPGRFAVVLRYGGLVGLVCSAVVLSQASAFPGWVAAWPVLSTAMVILAGDCEGHDPLDVTFTHPIVQWLGNISYSIYLVHWPLIVAMPFVVGPPRLRHRLAVLVLTLALAHLSRRYLEDILAHVPGLLATSRRTLLTAATAMVIVLLAAQGLVLASAQADAQREQTVGHALRSACAGGQAALNRERCPQAFTAPPVVQVGPSDFRVQPVPGCTKASATDPFRECSWGAPRRTVAVVGDSHVQHYDAALIDIAKRNKWRLLSFTRLRCAPADGPVPAFLGKAREDPGECSEWIRSVTPQLRAHKVDLVITSAYATAEPITGADPRAAYQRVWKEWSTFTEVAVLRDVPATGERDMPACLSQHRNDRPACARPRAQALAPDQMWLAAQSTTDPRVHPVDLSAAYCDDLTCYAVVGGLPVYYDRNHITRTFARTLVPALERALPGTD